MHVCVRACLCLFVREHISETTPNYCACYMWPWLGLPPVALRYVMYFRFYGWRYFYTIARNMRRERASTKSGSVAFVPENQFDSFSGSDRTPICDRRAPCSFINDEIYHTKDFADFHAHCVKAHNCFQATCLTIKCALLPYFYFLSTPKIVRNTALQIRPGFLAHPL